MTPVEVAARLLAGLALVFANGFFVAIEFALTRVRQFSESEFDRPALQRAWSMTEDLEIYLTSCQVGITASSIALGIVAEPALGALLEPTLGHGLLGTIGAGGIVAFLVINLVHLTHGEQTPTYLGVERSKFVCRWGARPLYWFTRLILPVIRVGDTVAKWTLGLFGIEMSGAWLETGEAVIESRADLRNALGDVLERGDLADERREEVIGALDVGQAQVRDRMVPTEEIVFLSTAVDPEENIDRIGASPHVRFPLVERDDEPESFVGVVYVPAVVDNVDDLRAGETTFADVASPPMTLAAEESLSDAIDQFQAQNHELALVIDDGDVVGLLTATDAFEAVMGELEDPLDEAVGGN